MAGIMYLKDLIICLNFRYFDFTYADIILRLTVKPRWHFKIFYVAENTLDSSSPKGSTNCSGYARTHIKIKSIS